MPELLVLGLIILVIYVIYKLTRKSTGTGTSSTPSPQPPYRPVETKRDPNVYRPSTGRRPSHSRIKFKDPGQNTDTHDQDVRDLVDALTGAPLDPKLGLYQCRQCKVFYQTQSVEVIQSENGGRCVSCLHTQIENVTGKRKQRGRNADVSVVTLENYWKFVGHVITFEGLVHTVLMSRRGTDYAVMFEDTSWTRGFKMVVFRGDVNRIGGPPFLSSMIGHRVIIRGLLIRHKRYGYEIIVSDRAMILSTL